jgi:hypothetical protein
MCAMSTATSVSMAIAKAAMRVKTPEKKAPQLARRLCR